MRTRDKRTFALSALKSDLCIHPERVRCSVIIKNRFRGLGRGGVKENDRRHVLPEGRCYACHLLGQHPNTDAYMSSRKGKMHQLACTPFHIFGRCAVIEDYESVCRPRKQISRSSTTFPPGAACMLSQTFLGHFHQFGGRSCCARMSGR